MTLYRHNGRIKYRGEVINDRFDGWGEAYYTNGDIFTGYWAEGKKDGYGEFKMSKPYNQCRQEIYAGNILDLRSFLIKDLKVDLRRSFTG